MKHWRRWLGVAAISSSLVLATGCSIADTAPNQMALHYKNGPLSNRVYMGCVQPSSYERHKLNDDFFYYPNSAAQRTLVFGPNGDFPALSITAEGQTMPVNANMTFHLNANCQPFTDKAGKFWPGGILQKFHETIGMQYQAYATDGGDEPGPGWDKALDRYLAAPTERAVSNEALSFGWFALYNDPVAKQDWEDRSKKEIPKLVLEQTGEPYFIIDNILLQKPMAPPNLQNELQNKQAATLRQQTADIDKAAGTNFPGGITAYIAYQQQLSVIQLQQSIARAISEGKVQAVPVPAGSPVIVGGGK